MSKPTLEFWFEFASTYSYLAAERIEAAAAAAGVAVASRPFLLGPIFASMGWNDSPFKIYPSKGRYMWRDMERLCGKHGLPFRRPGSFPRNGLLAARVALLSMQERWLPQLVRAVFRANFVEDRDIADPGVISAILDSLGQDQSTIIMRARSAGNKALLRRQTGHASAIGIFGAPSFVAAGEIFWGNDRLEDALDWCRRG